MTPTGTPSASHLTSQDAVFIVGAARSGTSLLYRTLQKHSVFQPSEPNLDETYFFQSLPHAWLFHQGYPPALDAFMLGDPAYLDFLHRTRMYRFGGAPFGLLNELFSGRSRTLWRLGFGRQLVRHFVYYARLARGCVRLVEKTPTHLPYVPHLLEALPQARILFIYRHPVDVYTSYVRRGAFDQGGSFEALTSSWQDFASHYRREIVTAMRFAQRCSRVLLIPYESLTTRPLEELHRITRFLEVPFEAKIAVEREPDLSRWAPDPHLFGGINPKTKDWRAYVSSTTATALQASLRDILDTLGYPWYADDGA